MMENIKVKIINNIAIIAIDNQKKMNCLNVSMLKSLKSNLKNLKSNSKVYGVIITGAGSKSFVAGADITLFKNLNVSKSFEFSKEGNLILKMIEEFPKPIIAAINGYALGGGCELALACHYRIASENSSFGQPEIKLGIIPGFGGTQRLAAIVGKSMAIRMILSGEIISNNQALSIGLIDEVVKQKDLLSHAIIRLQEMVKYYDPKLTSRAIKLINVSTKGTANYNKEAIEFSKSFKEKLNNGYFKKFNH